MRKWEVCWGHALGVYTFLLAICSPVHLPSFWLSVTFPSPAGAPGHGPVCQSKGHSLHMDLSGLTRARPWGKRNNFSEGVWVTRPAVQYYPAGRALGLILKRIFKDLWKISLGTWCACNFQASPGLNRGWFWGIWLCSCRQSFWI